MGGHLHRRRPAHHRAHQAPPDHGGAGRDRARQGDPLPHPGAGGRPRAGHRRAGGGPGHRDPRLGGGPHQSQPGDRRGGARRAAAAEPGRRPAAQPDRAAARGERHPGGAGGAVPDPRGQPGEALLPAPRRPRAGHRALPHHDRRGPGAGPAAARAGLRHLPAHLRPRHPRRPREGADRPLLPGARRGGRGRDGRRRRHPCRDRSVG